MSMKLYVGNLPYQVTDQELNDMFSPFGAIVSAVVIRDRMTQRSKGFGFVEFENREDGEKAAAEMNGKEMNGRPLTVNEARPMEPRAPRQGGYRDAA